MTSLLVERLRRMKEAPFPLLIEGMEDAVCPGSSLWSGGRQVQLELQAAGLTPGERVAVELPNGIRFVQVLLGVLRVGGVFCPLPPGLPEEDRESWLEQLEPHWVWSGSLAPGGGGRSSPRDAAFILGTSGSSSGRSLVCLSEANVLSVLDSHGPLLNHAEGRHAVSSLSWSHAFGLIIELIPLLAAGAEIHVPGAHLLDRLRDLPDAFFCAAPRSIERILAEDPSLLRGRPGVIGAAPLGPRLCEQLCTLQSQLRVGYGLTEAGPGVSLGSPGDLRPGFLGAAVGCEARVIPNGELAVKGANIALSTWSGKPLRRDGEWLLTGDLVDRDHDGGLWFRGRRSRAWKWSNGSWMHPEAEEVRIAEELGDPVCLLKLEGDAMALVVFGDAVPEPMPRVKAVIHLSRQEGEACFTPNGKVRIRAAARAVERQRPDILLDAHALAWN